MILEKNFESACRRLNDVPEPYRFQNKACQAKRMKIIHLLGSVVTLVLRSRSPVRARERYGPVLKSDDVDPSALDCSLNWAAHKSMTLSDDCANRLEGKCTLTFSLGECETSSRC